MRKALFSIALPLAALAATFPPAARADYKPMIQIGSGAEAASSGPVNVLLRVEFEFSDAGGNSRYGNRRLATEVLARVRSDLSVSPGADGKMVAYADIEFVPMAVGGCTNGLRETCLRGGISTGHFQRNVRLGNQGIGKVSLLRGEIEHASAPDSRTEIFARVAAELMTLMISTDAPQVRYMLWGPGRISASAGATRELGRGIKARIQFGGSADIATGSLTYRDWESGSATRAEVSAYAEVGAEFRDFIHLFVRNGMNGIFGDFTPNELEYQLMAGMAVKF